MRLGSYYLSSALLHNLPRNEVLLRERVLNRTHQDTFTDHQTRLKKIHRISFVRWIKIPNSLVFCKKSVRGPGVISTISVIAVIVMAACIQRHQALVKHIKTETRYCIVYNTNSNSKHMQKKAHCQQIKKNTGNE